VEVQDVEKVEKNSGNMTRREFLVGAGGFAAGAAVGAVLGGGALNLVPTALAADAAPVWPMPYKKLDPEVVRKAGYQAYYEGGCCYGAFKAVLGELQKQVGAPFTSIPLDMMRYGEGGSAGWGTLCGALNGSSAAINLVTGKADYPKLVNDLNGWYTVTPFPSTKCDDIAKFKDQPANACGSPLCHASVSDWCKVAKKKVSDPERLDRCAKVTGDVAAKAVEYLNALADAKFAASYKPSELFAGCLGCHNGKDSMLNNEQGKMNCVPCHGDPHKK
jgi:hypothetical protein